METGTRILFPASFYSRSSKNLVLRDLHRLDPLVSVNGNDLTGALYFTGYEPKGIAEWLLLADGRLIAVKRSGPQTAFYLYINSGELLEKSS